MAKLTAAQDKAIQAFGANGEFPKGTRVATIEGIRTAGLIEGDINKGVLIADGKSTPAVYVLTDDGRTYLGLEPIVTTVDEIQAELNTNPWDFAPTLPDGWDMSKRNRNAWEGLSQEEINADIATAYVVANRRDRRSGNVAPVKHKLI